MSKDLISMSLAQQLPEVIDLHSWNEDHSLLSVSLKKQPVIVVYSVAWKSATPVFTEVYRNNVDYTKRITGFSWNKYDYLAVCAEDSKGFIYIFDKNNLKNPSIKNIVMEKACYSCTAISWSPNNETVAIAFSNMSIYSAKYIKDNDNYPTRVLTTKITAPIICIAWHPSSLILAAGSANGEVYIVRLVDTDESVSEVTPLTPMGFGPQSIECAQLEDTKKKSRQRPILTMVKLSSWVVGLDFISTNGFADYSQDMVVAVTADSRISWFDASCCGFPSSPDLARMSYANGYIIPRLPTTIPLPFAGIVNSLVLRGNTPKPSIIAGLASGDLHVCTAEGKREDNTFSFTHSKLELLEASNVKSFASNSIMQRSMQFSKLGEIKLHNKTAVSVHNGVVQLSRIDQDSWSSSSNQKIILWKLNKN